MCNVYDCLTQINHAEDSKYLFLGFKKNLYFIIQIGNILSFLIILILQKVMICITNKNKIS